MPHNIRGGDLPAKHRLCVIPRQVEAVVASGIAVLGTLLGSGLTLAFQRRTTENSHKFTRSESLRQERLDAYCVYAGALLYPDDADFVVLADPEGNRFCVIDTSHG